MSPGNRLSRWIAGSVRATFPKPAGRSRTPDKVFRVAEAGAVKDPWMRRVAELADGRSVEDIAEALYLEELRSGAGAADIGLWGTALHRDVAQTIGELARQGYVRIQSSGSASLGQ